MTDDELAAIEARANAATPGPWMSFNTDDTYAMNIYGVTTSYELWACEPEKDNGHGNIIALTLLQTPRYSCHESRLWHENTMFIAHARADIPALIAALRAERVHHNEVDLARSIIKRANEHTAEMERLRTRLAEATALINAAVELMTKEQVGQWPGVRAWLEGEE